LLDIFNLIFYSIWFQGDEREAVAKACLLEANGSSYKYVNNKVAELVQENDEDMDIIIKSGQLKNLRRIVSKCVNEFLHNETVR
jgi:hypothetical protein